ncbi:MAG: hypothetical protein KUG77_11365, partial [Nannocystaceae bacterium]|nr:hypothetical protein [Nannocystaceae bacterium]
RDRGTTGTDSGVSSGVARERDAGGVGASIGGCSFEGCTDAGATACTSGAGSASHALAHNKAKHA